jgi:hypothetical protein
MALVQDDHVIQAVAAHTPDQPFDVGVLPRTPGGDDHLLDPHMLYPLPKGGAIRAVPIVQQISRCFVPWERVNDLLGGPRGGRMLADINMHDSSPLMCQDHQDKEYLVCHGRHHQAIQATKSLTWLFKNVFHVGEGGLRDRTRYFSTVDFATSIRSFRSSPTIRGEPHVGFACHIAWMSSRTSLATAGRPGVPC